VDAIRARVGLVGIVVLAATSIAMSSASSGEYAALWVAQANTARARIEILRLERDLEAVQRRIDAIPSTLRHGYICELPSRMQIEKVRRERAEAYARLAALRAEQHRARR
jgi:hypothetical protein